VCPHDHGDRHRDHRRHRGIHLRHRALHRGRHLGLRGHHGHAHPDGPDARPGEERPRGRASWPGSAGLRRDEHRPDGDHQRQLRSRGSHRGAAYLGWARTDCCPDGYCHPARLGRRDQCWAAQRARCVRQPVAHRDRWDAHRGLGACCSCPDWARTGCSRDVGPVCSRNGRLRSVPHLDRLHGRHSNEPVHEEPAWDHSGVGYWLQQLLRQREPGQREPMPRWVHRSFAPKVAARLPRRVPQVPTEQRRGSQARQRQRVPGPLAPGAQAPLEQACADLVSGSSTSPEHQISVGERCPAMPKGHPLALSYRQLFWLMPGGSLEFFERREARWSTMPTERILLVPSGGRATACSRPQALWRAHRPEPWPRFSYWLCRGRARAGRATATISGGCSLLSTHRVLISV